MQLLSNIDTVIKGDYSGEAELRRLVLHSVGFERSHRAYPNKVAHNIQLLSNIDTVISSDYRGEKQS